MVAVLIYMFVVLLVGVLSHPKMVIGLYISM